MHSNRVPLLFRLPGVTSPQQLTAFAENVDIMPTIAELAGIAIPPRCETEQDSLSKALCTEGQSLAPLINEPRRLSTKALGPRAAEKSAAFWQWTKQMIEHLPVMGYAMATDDSGSTYRYTEVRNAIPVVPTKSALCLRSKLTVV